MVGIMRSAYPRLNILGDYLCRAIFVSIANLDTCSCRSIHICRIVCISPAAKICYQDFSTTGRFRIVRIIIIFVSITFSVTFIRIVGL